MSGPLTDEQRNTLSHVKSSSERLLVLIEDLLELTALRRGEVRVQVELFDPRAALEAALEATRRSRRRASSCARRFPNGPPRWMRSDRQKVVQDSVQAARQRVQVHRAGRGARDGAGAQRCRAIHRIAIRGSASPSTAQQLVFDEFRQVDGSTTRQYGGSGLGLALARRLARLLGGDIQLESAPEEGSSFVVEIPLEFSQDLQPAVALPG